MNILSYEGDHFLMDGEKFTILSGSIHYFRVVPEYWEDRLKKLKACGFNTVETYTCWNLHERKEGEFDFTGMLDIAKFIETAQKLGLYVIVRPGPYICAEWEMGGLPSWLLSYPEMRIRCYDELYLSKVRRYYDRLFQELRPLLNTNGGNIIAVQIENEYGSFGNDKRYLEAVAQIYRDNQVDCLLFTSDGAVSPITLAGGTLNQYLATANFGSHAKENFETLRKFRPNQPLMCCEFWDGWFDHWYEEHHVRDAADIAKTLEEILKLGGSVNFYMFHGGTNFGFTNGANHTDGVYQPTVTSYDYSCLCGESGNLTEQYYAVKEVLERHFGKAPEIEVSELPRHAYGTVALTERAPLFQNLDALTAKAVHSAAPLSMEQMGQEFGFILYGATVSGPTEELELTLEGLGDRAHIFIDGKLCGIKENTARRDDKVTLELAAGESASVQILVENMGRTNYGHRIFDHKGISGLCLGQQYQFGFENRSLPLSDLSGLSYRKCACTSVPAFLRGCFQVEEKADTFLRLDGFQKGAAWLNGFNLGRYWNTAGPQKTLYIPAPLLKEGENELIVLELDGYEVPQVLLTDRPDLG